MSNDKRADGRERIEKGRQPIVPRPPKGETAGLQPVPPAKPTSHVPKEKA